MKKISVIDAVDKGVPFLTSRQSAQRIKAALAEEKGHRDGSLVLDFSGAEGAAPSFLDEALVVAEEFLSDSGQANATVTFSHPPATLAAKHRAIARGHGRVLVETENGDWEFRKP